MKVYIHEIDESVEIINDEMVHHNGKHYEIPSKEDLQWMWWDHVGEALDGCSVDMDGWCEHNSPSWLLVLQLAS
jgi:hypothetical protein